MVYLRVTVTLSLTFDLVFNNRVLSISPMLFDLGIPNSVCDCILVWQSVIISSMVTVTLTYFLELSCQENISFIEAGLSLVYGCIFEW